MFFHYLISPLLLAAVLSSAVADPNSICYSYGIDYVDGGSYFINSQSSESFTTVSTFEGCNNGTADVLLVHPNGDEDFCTQVPTTPPNTPELSTCPILKSQMDSGEWIIILVGNNGDGQPFAWERDIYLNVGIQATTTYTPTVTYSVTTTPTSTVSSTATVSIISTTGPFTTVTVPTATAAKTKSITPAPVTSTQTQTFTRTSLSLTQKLSLTTKTVTATCTTSTRRRDKPCTYSPTLLHPAALVTPTTIPKVRRNLRKLDRSIDYELARRRVEAAKLKRNSKPKAIIQQRAPDAPTITITALPPVNTTTTSTAPAITTTESYITTTTSTSTLPPATVFSGIYTSTTTLPTPTRTRFAFTTTSTVVTKTIAATFTYTTTVTPSASISACKARGGHFRV